MRRALTISCAMALTGALPVLAAPQATIRVDPSRLQGTHPSGRILLYSPDPVQPGSSISHWDPTATPNLLMEPSINADLAFLGLDLSVDLMRDIGWPAGASTFEIIPLDGGFFSDAPFGGAPGNPATTLGEARVNLVQAVLGAWGAELGSPVNVQALVAWTPLPCFEGQGAVLAAAGTTFVFRDHPSFPRDGTWYHAPLAESLAGEDLTGPPEEEGGDIIVLINSAIDEGCLGAGTSYYYGLDGNDPAHQVDLAPVVLHELAHGLGFSNFSDETNGELLGEMPGIYDVFTYDEDLGETWDQLTAAERVESAENVRDVTWSGPEVTAAAQTALDSGVLEMTISGAGGANGVYSIGTAVFGPSIPPAGLTAPLACLEDGVFDPSFLDGCSPATNPGALDGKIALVDRGACGFTTKVANAQAAGAVGVIVVNNAGDSPPVLGGTDPSIEIPAVSVGRTDGQRIRRAVCPASAAAIGPGGRFQAEVQWVTDTDSGDGVPVPMTADSSFFWFFDPDNSEVVVKVLDACGRPAPRFWVFLAGLTTLEAHVTITDTETGATGTYSNEAGTLFMPVVDFQTFDTCE